MSRILGSQILDSQILDSQILRYLEYVFWISGFLGVLQACILGLEDTNPRFLDIYIDILESRYQVLEYQITRYLEYYILHIHESRCATVVCEGLEDTVKKYLRERFGQKTFLHKVSCLHEFVEPPNEPYIICFTFYSFNFYSYVPFRYREQRYIE